MRYLMAVAFVSLVVPSVAQDKPPVNQGWMDIQDSPSKHPGPWLKINDTPQQAQLRKELSGAGQIVYSSNRDGNWEIYICRADGSGQKNLTNHSAWDGHPRWTADGKILFFSDRDSEVKLSQVWDQTMEGPAKGIWAFHKQKGDDFRNRDVEGLDVMPHSGVYLMDADGGNIRLLVKEARRASLATNGKWLAFERRGKTMTKNLDTGEEFDAVQRYFGLSASPQFSPDGRRLLVASGGDTVGLSSGGGGPTPPPQLMATIFDLKPDGRPAGPYRNVATGSLTLCPRWTPDGRGLIMVQGMRETWLQAIDLEEQPNEHGWLDGQMIGLAQPADRFHHAFPVYSPSGKYVAFSLSPLHFTVREQVAPLGYKPWKGGNQIVWQELCVGRAEPGKDNVWVQLTEGGYANRDSDWR